MELDCGGVVGLDTAWFTEGAFAYCCDALGYGVSYAVEDLEVLVWVCRLLRVGEVRSW